MALGGLGTEDKGLYKPQALNGWTSVGSHGKFKWVYGEKVAGRKIELPEDELGELEWNLLRESPPAVKFWREQKMIGESRSTVQLL